MRRLFAWFLPLLFTSTLLIAQTGTMPQTARQALIEMFFGTAPNHLEKHLPDTTRNAFKKMSGPNGVSALDEMSMFATMAKAGGGKFETFDTGPVLLHVEDPRENQTVDITVESDNLSGDEDQIEVALHVTKDEKEQVLPFVPRFTFVMKTEADVWRLSEISVTLRVPLEDPSFLKTIEQEHAKQSEQMARMNVQIITSAEKTYQSTHGSYACSVAELAKAKTETDVGGKSMSFPLLRGELSTGKSGEYVFAISGCDGTQYKVVAEPDTPDSGEKAFCSDESGSMKSSSDGKATTCLSSGEPVQQTATGLAAVAVGGTAGASGPSGQIQAARAGASGSPGVTFYSATVPANRVRVSERVSQAMVVRKVQPNYPADAGAAHVQGRVVLSVLIDKDGNVESVRPVSGHPQLAPAAIDAVKQWKYRPYLLNGSPVEVDTQATINFTLPQ